MKKKLFITFGCSWMYGVGVGYHSGQSVTEYYANAWDPVVCDTKSFRGVLSKNFGLDNKNFSMGGSSNQHQFNSAKKYFGSYDFKKDQEIYEDIIVLHAITSTARNVFFDPVTQQVIHFKYFDNYKSPIYDKFGKFMCKYAYDHNYEVMLLEQEMHFWNIFYESTGIKNIWVDTINHHLYHYTVKNMIDIENRDLLSQLCIKNNINKFDNKYHYSDQINQSHAKIDSNRIKFLINIGLLNPISNHPTEQGHLQIAEFIAPVLESKL